MTGLHQRLSDGRKNRCHCEKNDNHSAIDYPAWMITTLFYINCSAQYEPSV
jgi:hypothetical protein